MKRLLLIACAVGLSAGTAQAASVEGFGNGVPLEMAVQQILPDGYSVAYHGVDRHARVSWQGGSNWQSVLRSIRSGGHQLSVSVSGKHVVLSDAPPVVATRAPQASEPRATVAPQLAMVTPNPAQRGLVIMPMRQPETRMQPQAEAVVLPTAAPAETPRPEPIRAAEPMPQAAPPVPAPEARPEPRPEPRAEVAPPAAEREAPPRRLSAREQRAAAAAQRAAERSSAQAAQAEVRPAVHTQTSLVSADNRIWRAPQGKALDQVLGDWADRAGWTLVFNSRMIYELQSGAEFEGDFIEAASALVRSVRALPQPMAMIYRGNKTIVVSNRADQAN